jgi:hypothetical protein
MMRAMRCHRDDDDEDDPPVLTTAGDSTCRLLLAADEEKEFRHWFLFVYLYMMFLAKSATAKDDDDARAVLARIILPTEREVCVDKIENVRTPRPAESEAGPSAKGARTWKKALW